VICHTALNVLFCLLIPAQLTSNWRTINLCGVNSTYAMLRYHQCQASYDDVRSRLNFNEQEGTSLQSIAECLESFGLEVIKAKSKTSDLLKYPLPVIAHLETNSSRGSDGTTFGHYVLVYQLEDDHVYFMDGTTGMLKEISSQVFFNQWSGYLIVASKKHESSILFSGMLAGAVGFYLIWRAVQFFILRRIRTKTTLAVILGLAFFAVPSACADDEKVKVVDFLVNMDELQRRQNSVRSAKLSFTIQESSEASPEDLLTSYDRSLMEMASIEFAFSGQKRRLVQSIRRAAREMTGTSEVYTLDKSGEMVKKVEVFKSGKFGKQELEETSYFFDGKELATISGDDVRVVPGPFEIGPMRAFNPMYPMMVLWNIPDPTASSSQQEEHRRELFFSGEVTIRKESSPIRLRIEKTDSYRGGTLKTWLDPSLGYSIVKRTVEHETDGVLFSASYSNPIEVVEGFWLPSLIEGDEYLFQPGKEKCSIRTVVKCQISDVGSVADGLFEPQVRTGAKISVYQQPFGQGGPVISHYAAADGSIVDSTTIPRKPHVKMFFTGLIAIMVIGLFVYVLRNKWTS
jgi:hypothetical protein